LKFNLVDYIWLLLQDRVLCRKWGQVLSLPWY